MKTGKVKNDTAEIYYEIYGKGEPLVFLHGNSEDLTYFKKQVSVFKQKYQLIFIDSRGHGKSTLGEKELNLQRMASDVLAVLNYLSYSKVHLLGFSDGGNIALTFALNYKDRVKSLILNGANLCPKGVKWSVQIPCIYVYLFWSLFAPFSKHAKKRKQITGLMVNEPKINFKSLKNIKIPVLVIAGEHDMILDKHTKLIGNSIPGSKIEIIPFGDHFIAAKKPKEFNRAVMEFLETEGTK